MPLLLLIRHGENEFVKTNKLAGHLPGVHLNERGRQQVADLAAANKDVKILDITENKSIIHEAEAIPVPSNTKDIRRYEGCLE